MPQSEAELPSRQTRGSRPRHPIRTRGTFTEHGPFTLHGYAASRSSHRHPAAIAVPLLPVQPGTRAKVERAVWPLWRRLGPVVAKGKAAGMEIYAPRAVRSCLRCSQQRQPGPSLASPNPPAAPK
jgi:hypothetical protein